MCRHKHSRFDVPADLSTEAQRTGIEASAEASPNE